MGATELKCNFFLQICNEVPGEKKRGLSPPQRATGPCRPPQGRQAPVARGGATGSPVSILVQIGTIASVLFFFRKFTTVMPFFSYVVLYLSDYYATFDI